MAKTMGINIKSMTISKMKSQGLLDQIPDAAQAVAFIYNGDVYINSDVATIDSKIHELMHILLGAMRFKQPELYSEIIQSV
jgi:sulfur carrier protein ThiS